MKLTDTNIKAHEKNILKIRINACSLKTDTLTTFEVKVQLHTHFNKFLIVVKKLKILL